MKQLVRWPLVLFSLWSRIKFDAQRLFEILQRAAVFSIGWMNKSADIQQSLMKHKNHQP